MGHSHYAPIGLIENLRRLSTQIAFDRINQNLADYWAEQMTSTAEKDPKSLILVIADMARSNPPMVSSFVAELTRQLQGKGPALALPLNWIEQRLSETSQTGNELINLEIQKQAADQVSMSNSIGSLRFLGTMDWREFVESLSVVEHTLQKDISGVYSRMDFATRDTYRHVVEKIAKYSELSEQEIADRAIRLANNYALRNGSDDRTAHVGYFLVDKGVSLIEKGARISLPIADSIQKIIRSFPLLFYTGSIILISILFGGLLTVRAYNEGLSSWLLIIVGILSFLCTATSPLHWLIGSPPCLSNLAHCRV
jgi:hypothetical protein